MRLRARSFRVGIVFGIFFTFLFIANVEAREKEAFQGVVVATTGIASGSGNRSLRFTRKDSQLRIEVEKDGESGPINLINLTTDEVTILLPKTQLVARLSGQGRGTRPEYGRGRTAQVGE